MAKGESGCFLGLGGLVALALVGVGIWFGSRPSNDLAAAVKEYQSLGLPMKLDQVTDHDLKPEEDLATYLGKGRDTYKSEQWQQRILREPDMDISALPEKEQAEVNDLLHAAEEIDHCKGLLSVSLQVEELLGTPSYTMNARRLVTLLCMKAKEAAFHQNLAAQRHLQRAWELVHWMLEKRWTAAWYQGRIAGGLVLDTVEQCGKQDSEHRESYRKMVSTWSLPTADYSTGIRVSILADLQDFSAKDGQIKRRMSEVDIEKDLSTREISFKMQPLLAKTLRRWSKAWRGKHDLAALAEVSNAGVELRQPFYKKFPSVPVPKSQRPIQTTIEDLAAHLKALQKSVIVISSAEGKELVR